MKLCWDNIEDLYLTKRGNLKKRNYPGVLWVVKICKQCGEEFLAQKRCSGYYCSTECSGKAHTGEFNGFYGKTHTDIIKEKLSISAKSRPNPLKGRKGKDSPSWKGGLRSRNLACYDTEAPQLEWCEEVRRNEKEPLVMEVKCTHCGKWFIPTLGAVRRRIDALNGRARGEFRLYCSKACKKACPIYQKTANTLMKEDALRAGRLEWMEMNREVQPELRQMVLARDNYTCKNCGSKDKPLHCHHIYPASIDPIESADLDNCMTLCEDCHKEVHKKDGCRYSQLRIEVC
jgi:5-methylcytosine-specific restriction endonuclease McrA